ncbi:hypothetical protein JOM56_013022 [Amanita muscaria]
MKRKRFKSTKKRKVNDINTAQTLAKRFGSEPEMDSDGLFPNPIYGYKDAIDEFMNEDSIDDSFMLDREIRAFDRDYPFADQSYETPQVSIPAALTPITPAAPLPPSSLLDTTSTLPLPKRARTEPLPSKPVQTALPSRAQTAPPEVSKNTLTARRCTNKDASPSSFVKFMDIPVTMTREHIHDCLKDNRKWSTVDISNVEIFAIKNKDSTVVNVLKIKFKDDALSTTAKKQSNGEDFDYLIKSYRKTSTDISKNLQVLGKLKKEVEKAKHALSSQQSVRIEIESFEDSNVLMTKPESITIKNAKGRLSQEEIKRMLKPSST